jgi:hypothetical protein
MQCTDKIDKQARAEPDFNCHLSPPFIDVSYASRGKEDAGSGTHETECNSFLDKKLVFSSVIVLSEMHGSAELQTAFAHLEGPVRSKVVPRDVCRLQKQQPSRPHVVDKRASGPKDARPTAYMTRHQVMWPGTAPKLSAC